MEAIGLKPELEIDLWQLGEARESVFSSRARAWEQREPRYRWLGGLAREKSLSILKQCWGLINSSRIEGGSNAILEAMVLGVPVMATQIEPNVGLLGLDYEGYFEVESSLQCAELITRFLGDREFRNQLEEQVLARAKLFNREQERLGWRKLLVEGGMQSGKRDSVIKLE